MTGKESIYTTHEEHEVMFHVSTLLPFSKEDCQQVVIFTHSYSSITSLIVGGEKKTHRKWYCEYYLCGRWQVWILIWQGKSPGTYRKQYCREDMAKFKPVFIKSQFTHVYAVVCCQDDQYYLTVYSEKSVPLFGPSIPGHGFCDHQAFR